MDFIALAKLYDSIEMIKLIDAWPEQFRRAFELGYATELPTGFSDAQKIVGLGMGGSGMGYTILGVMARSLGTVPLEVVSDYNLPPYITKESRTAACVTSFSGNTEETLSAAKQAYNRGCPMVCITTGGKLAPWAKQNGTGLVHFKYPVPLPRVGLSYTFGIALGVLCQAELLRLESDAPKVIDASLAGLARFTQSKMKQQAKEIAEQLYGKMVYIVGVGWSYPVAIRWKGQINENAKQIAFAESMPEMCHNMFLGYDLPQSIRRKSAIIFLDSAHEHPQNIKRAELVGGDLAAAGVTVLAPAVAKELSPLGTVLAQIMLGDYVSYYLALLNHKDPSDQERIENLKKRL